MMLVRWNSGYSGFFFFFQGSQLVARCVRISVCVSVRLRVSRLI